MNNLQNYLQDYTRHNYIKKLLKMIKDGTIPPSIPLANVSVGHDAWCAFLVTGGWCDCNPDVSLLPPDTPTE